MHDGTLAPTSTHRFNLKREAIVSAATEIINRHGVKGMTLAGVAEKVGLITTSVTYYFKKKEDLAVACFLQSLERYDVLITRSLGAADPHDRFLAFLTNFLELNRRIREGEEAPLAVFNDVRSLRDPHFTIVMTRYRDVFRKIRSIFAGPGYEWMTLKKATARSHMLLEQLFWSVTWLPRYDTEDYPRIRDRMFDIFAHGVARDGAQWQPVPLAALYRDLGDSHETSRETFLRAATKLINFRGYRGASVEKISAQLNVTKGSFYHHNEAKDDLVVACFERSFGIMRRAQSFAMRGDGDLWCKLSSAAAALVEYQLSDAGPLLRSSALSALPEPIRQNMVDQFSRASDRFAAMISDGIAEGSLRAVDPSIAAQMLNATLNGSADLPFVIPGLQGAEMGKLYAKPMLMGIFER
jgi:AcrR family transcriptional regulator